MAMKNLNMDDFTRIVLTAWPDAIIDENQYGELVVLTGHKLDGDRVVRIDPDESF
jgi:hypothetical protein